MASFSFQAHAKQIQAFPYLEFIRDYEKLKLLIVKEKSNQTTVQVCLLVLEKVRTYYAVWTNHKNYSGFQHSISQPIAFLAP